MTYFKTALIGAAFLASAAGANAATYTADELISNTPGVCTGSPEFCALNDRQNAENAVDGDSNSFYALGFGGEIVVGFSQLMANLASTVSVLEITFNRETGHDEAADVYAIDGDGNESLLGRINNLVAGSSVFANAPFEFLRLVDVSLDEFPDTESYDGYDVAQINVAAVPLPAAGLMLMGGLGGLAALRRRKKNA